MKHNKKGADTRAINIIIAGILIAIFIFVFYKWFDVRSTDSSISIQQTTIAQQELQQTFATFLVTYADRIPDADAEQISRWIRQSHGLSPEPPEDPTYSSTPEPNCKRGEDVIYRSSSKDPQFILEAEVISCNVAVPYTGRDETCYRRANYEGIAYLASKTGIIAFKIESQKCAYSE